MKRHWFPLILLLLILASPPTSVNAQADSPSLLTNPPASFPIVLIGNLSSILVGIAAIISAKQSQNTATEARKKTQELQDLSYANNPSEQLKLNSYLTGVLLGENSIFRQELEHIIQDFQAIQTRDSIEKLVHLYITQGDKFFSNKQYEEAINIYNQTLKLKPEEHDVLYKIGNAFSGLGNYEQAILYYQKIVSHQHNYEWVWHSLGNALLAIGSFNEAIHKYDKAAKINPENYEHWYNLGNAQAGAGKYQEAIKSYKEALRFRKDKFWIYHSLGDVLRKLHSYEEAIQSYKTALEINPNNYESRHKLGKALSGLGKYQEAIENYDQLMGYYEPPSLWLHRSYVLCQLGQTDEASRSFDTAIEKCDQMMMNSEGKDEGALYEKARCYAFRGDVDLALKNLKQAINLNHKYKEGVKTDSDFDAIRDDKHFQRLIEDC
jgi:tetratricopeptide (TPR) repeat protein